MPQFFTRIEYKRLIVPCCSKTCCACGFTLALELIFAFALTGLIINFIVEVPVIPTSAVFTSGGRKSYVERNFTTQTQLQFNEPVRLRSATLGNADSYVKFSLFPDPSVSLGAASLDESGALPGPGYNLTYQLEVQTASHTKCLEEDTDKYACLLQVHSLTLVSNESATTNYTRVYISGAPGSSYVTSKSFFPLLIAVLIPLLILVLAEHEIRWKAL